MKTNNLGSDGMELEGNIKLTVGGDLPHEEGGNNYGQPQIKPAATAGATDGGAQPRRGIPQEFRNLNTLDEPVC
jgi:hypothetical protein